MIIEAGKYYRTRDGQKVGPMALPKPDDIYRWNVLGLKWGRFRDDGEDGNATGGTFQAGGDLISEWSEPMTPQDYNDGLWHGWNGGECPVDRASIVDVVSVGGLHFCGDEAWRIGWFDFRGAFRVTKPAPPKPREWWCVGLHMHDTEGEAMAFIDGLNAAHPEMDFGPIIHVREVLP